jgi:hypothetical protein
MQDVFSKEDVMQSWPSTEVSYKAWMSIRDADLLEELIIRLSQKKNNGNLKVVEWGGGRSTCWYTNVLEYTNTSYHWLMLEHNRNFFDRRIKDKIMIRRGSFVFYKDNIPENLKEIYVNSSGPICVVFEHGFVSPYGTGIYEDRLVNMDAYVDLPERFNIDCDLAIIDGRKRRRCVLSGKKLVGNHGYVVLHDAWRKHYQCAWPAFCSGRRFGDEWWIGANHETSFDDVLPWYAFSTE